jgi:hypothetical protein
MREQAIWAIGNIAGDGARYRDYVLECGGMDILIGNDYQVWLFWVFLQYILSLIES